MEQSNTNANNHSNNNHKQLQDNKVNDHLHKQPEIYAVINGIEAEGLIQDNKRSVKQLINDFVNSTGIDPFKTTLITIFIFLSLTMGLDKLSEWSKSSARISSITVNVDQEVQLPPIKETSASNGVDTLQRRHINKVNRINTTMYEKIRKDSLCSSFNSIPILKDNASKHMGLQFKKTLDGFIEKYGSPVLLSQFRTHIDWQIVDSTLTINKYGRRELSIILRHP